MFPSLPISRLLRFALCCSLMVGFSACQKKGRGLPKNLPNIALNSSVATPRHNLPSYSYPFDAHGNYVQAWAAEGERRAGRSAAPAVMRTQRRTVERVKAAPRSSRARVATRKTATASARYHTVTRGQTLSLLARRYNTSVAKIKSANGLRSDNIRVGQRLRIPR